ncbi:hypothetical protein JTE90_010911 [Oedothorax gibbosus]|uniref:FAS1 domain-containing protein n=1 Tax=Oedothorax gibbosus TaxID=931172 RepID=A0AAV6UHE9_9ARAC|nr:hypothetical protein JTE90_010911 [Oedothorax gibbosus]
MEQRKSKMLLINVLVMVTGFVGVYAGGGQQGTFLQQEASPVAAFENAPASEVEYVDGPLAPLYDFLIQKRMHKFCKLLREAGLEEYLQSIGGTFTVFVPTDASFVFLPPGTMDNLKKNPQQLRDFVLYHFVTGDFTSSDILNELIVESLQGAMLRFNIYGQVVTVSGAQIVEPDLEFESWRVHVIDHPLHPIPTGDTVTHLQNNNQRFYRLLLDSNLLDYISSGTFTILAPEDKAFDYLSTDLKNALQTNKTLAERVLMNHILPGSIYSGGITDGMQWETVGGAIITFTTKRGLIFANDVPIVIPDVPFTNGVIHTLNRVILPEGVEVDCHCKPSSDQRPQTPRQPVGQTRRPSFVQGLTTSRIPNEQSLVRQTPGQTPRPTARPRQPQQPTRGRQPPRPAPVLITRAPLQPAIQPQPEEELNAVVPEVPTGQKRPEQGRTTRYPTPSRRIPPPPSPRIAPPPRSQPPPVIPGDVTYPEQELAPVVTNPPRQTPQWANRQPTQATRYPPVPRASFMTTTTTRLPQVPRSQVRVTQPPIGKVPQTQQGFTTGPHQGMQPQRPANQPIWQQNQITRQTQQPRTTRQPPRVQPPPQRRPVQPRPVTFPTPVPAAPTEQPFESSRELPNCRQRSERINPSNQNLPICQEPQMMQEPCQNAPYNPSDSRPLCPANCRMPNEPFNPSDRRPVCPPTPTSVSGQGCRSPNQPTYVGDRRPLCTPPPPNPVQTGCRDPSAPFTPSDNRPLCPTPTMITPHDVPQSQGCRNANEPQDSRPLCPAQQQENCRNFMERPKAGDRRPICRTNQQQPRPNVNQQGPRPGNVPQTQQRQPQNQGSRSPNSQPARQQPWQTTRRPQDTTNLIRDQQVGKVPQVNGRPMQPHSQPSSGAVQPQPSPQPDYPPQPQPSPQPAFTLQPQPRPQQPDRRQPQPVQRQPQPVQRQPQPIQRQQQPNIRQQQQPIPRIPQQNTIQPVPTPRQPSFQQHNQRRPQIVPQQPQLGQPQTGFQPSTVGLGGPLPTSVTPKAPSRPVFIPQQQPGSRPQTQGLPTPPPLSFQPIQTTSLPVNRPTTAGLAQPRRPVQPQPGVSFPGRVTTTTRIPVSVTGTSANPEEDSRRTLYEIVEDPSLLIRGRPVKLTRIFELFHKAGIEDVLLGAGPTTVFLPSDDAFAALPKGVIEQLEENPELLRRVLLYHVAAIEIVPSAQGESYTVPSMAGDQLVITMLNGGRLILISGAKAIAVTRANNGIFYVINQLLYPLPHQNIVGAIQSRPDLSTLSWLLSQSGLEDMLQGQTPYTFLAPTDNAFAQLPAAVYDELTQNTTLLQEILLNHIMEGAHYGREFLTGGTFPSARGGKLKFQVVSRGYQVNEVNIKTPEIVTGTGVIHLIDEILLEEKDKKYFTKLENSIGTGQDVAQPINPQQPQPLVQPEQQPQRQPPQQRMSPDNQPTGLQPSGQWTGQRLSPGQRATTLRPNNGQQTGRQTAGVPSHGAQRHPTRASGTQMAVTSHRGGAYQPQMVQSSGQDGQQANVADLARAMGLNRFADWVTNTGLLEKVHDGGVYTVFAPTDDAVNSLPQDMLNSIDSNPEQTQSLLQYHVVPQRLNIQSLKNEETHGTLLQGKAIRFNVYQTPQLSCKQIVTASGTPIGEASVATMGSVQMIPVSQVLYQPTGSLQNILEASPILQKLAQAVRQHRLTWVVTGTGPLTFFAPSDAAFDSLSPEQKQSMIDDKQAFTELLKRHLVRGTYFSSGVQQDLQKNNENNQPMTISLQNGVLTVNSVPVTYSDITATNGVLHVIDQFLL